MALEHALLVALREQPASGLELAGRFGRSIGFFWSATHQQIYKTLARMDRDGWVEATEVAQIARPAKKVYAVSAAGADVLAAWLGEPTPLEEFRSELAVKLRGASFGEVEQVLAGVRDHLADHHARLDHYRQLEKRYPDVRELEGLELHQFLVLRGGVRLEQFWIDWLSEYLEAHSTARPAAHPTREDR